MCQCLHIMQHCASACEHLPEQKCHGHRCDDRERVQPWISGAYLPARLRMGDDSGDHADQLGGDLVAQNTRKIRELVRLANDRACNGGYSRVGRVSARKSVSFLTFHRDGPADHHEHRAALGELLAGYVRELASDNHFEHRVAS